MTDKYVRQILRYLVGDVNRSAVSNANGNLLERLAYLEAQEDAGLLAPVAAIKAKTDELPADTASALSDIATEVIN